MFNARSSLSIFYVLFLLIGLISATPVPITKGKAPAHAPAKAPAKAAPKGHAAPAAKGHAPAAKCPSKLHRRGGKVFLGYNGFNGTPRQAQASAGGELGAVFYIADAVDLAKAFAHGADPAKDYVCMVYADADAWAAQPKVWIPANAPRGNGMNAQYPGSVLFDGHTTAGLPAGSPAAVHQMGVRQAQISRLGITVECFAKSCFATDHHSMNYPTLMRSWGIQQGR